MPYALPPTLLRLLRCLPVLGCEPAQLPGHPPGTPTCYIPGCTPGRLGTHPCASGAAHSGRPGKSSQLWPPVRPAVLQACLRRPNSGVFASAEDSGHA